MKRIKTIAALAMALTLFACGCGSSVEEFSEPEFSNPFSSTQSYAGSEMPPPVSSEATLVSAGQDYTSTGIMNRLTGQDNLPEYMKNIRPVSVVMNNYISALPQNGISAADLVVEMEAEGGITRLLAMYSDWQNAPTVGSVREARLHFLDMAQAFDSIMVHIDASKETLDAIKSRKYSTLNGYYIADLTWRDAELRLTRAYEHTALTSGKLITDAINNRDIREEYLDTSPATFFNFAADGTIVKPTGFKARSIFLQVGNSAEYRFESATGLYKRYCAGGEQKDLNNDQQVKVTNVIVLFAAKTANATDPNLISLELTAGEGYLFTMGYGQKIYWQRDGGAGGRIVLYDDKGSELTLNQGKSWINIISKDSANQVSWAEIGA